MMLGHVKVSQKVESNKFINTRASIFSSKGLTSEPSTSLMWTLRDALFCPDPINRIKGI